MTRQRVFLLVCKSPILLFALSMFGSGLWDAYQNDNFWFVLAGSLYAYFFAWAALLDTSWQLPGIYRFQGWFVQSQPIITPRMIHLWSVQ
ncbi:hypothetical protein IQ22_03912 [Pseudomonas duriflava]|uniref:Uncharacterized protein n=1 Tax=Pseudomonas duriflava TaxID=459528 RepID=A0A562PYU7_9PSED|nr:hypothetical protein IQ22_03912 [Pseudomonas duriflava]